jgi:Cu(I)/Ag(I) efflux system membrane protein CusA/SilA
MIKAVATFGQHFLDADPDAEMLTTGFAHSRIKSLADLKGIEKTRCKSRMHSVIFRTRSVFAERTTGGYFLDFTVNREAAVRYGLRVKT